MTSRQIKFQYLTNPKASDFFYFVLKSIFLFQNVFYYLEAFILSGFIKKKFQHILNSG